MKFKFLKKAFAFALAGGLFLAPQFSESATATNVITLMNDSSTIVINDEEMEVSTMPFEYEGYTMVPLRFVGENVLQATINYNTETQLIELIRVDKTAYIDLVTGKVTVIDAVYESSDNMEAPEIDEDVLSNFVIEEVEEESMFVGVYEELYADELGIDVELIEEVLDEILNSEEVSDDEVEEDTSLTLPVAPIVVDGVTYVPLRFFSEIFDCTVDYNSETTVVTIVAPDPVEPEPDPADLPKPIANAQFANISAGQAIDYMDYSYDPNGYDIVARQWKISYKTEPTLYFEGSIREILTYPSAGYFTVSLSVKNSRGTWSEWYTTTFNVYENKAPKITDFYMIGDDGYETDIVKQGTDIDFVYEFTNEDWEEITSVNYYYTTKAGGTTYTKAKAPSALFSTADHDITLTLTDAFGNVSEPYTITVSAYNNVVMSEMEYKMNNLSTGEPYLNYDNVNFNLVAKQAEAQDIVLQDVQLLSSNNPETVTDLSILYQDYASGALRLRFHHRNLTGESMWLYAVAENETDEPITLTVKNLATAGPSVDVITVGANVVANYLKNNADEYTVTINPGEVYVINDASSILKNGYTSAGLIELETSGELKFSIVALPEDMDVADYNELDYHEKNSTHIRGTFEYATMEMSYVLSGKELEKIVIGREDAFDDYYVTGVDAITGDEVTNNGNRGVLHQLTITAEKTVGLLLNPRGTSYYGTIKNIDGEVYTMSYGGLMKGLYEATTLCVIEAGETVTIEYLAPSGSDTPLLLVAIPEYLWYEY